MMKDFSPIDAALIVVYKEHAAAWGGAYVILKCVLGDLINCTNRVLRFKKNHKERTEIRRLNSDAVVAHRSDLGQNIARVVRSLEQMLVLLGVLPQQHPIHLLESGDELTEASERLAGRLVELADSVVGHMNLMENCYREGLEKPSGNYLGSLGLEVREFIISFNNLLFDSYRYDKSDYESAMDRILDIMKTNRPETTYNLREVEPAFDMHNKWH